jgi:hypothetical protein
LKIFFILILFSFKSVFSQDEKNYILQNAIECKDWTAVNQNIYEILKDKKCICIGEMHGTKEPAELLVGLSRTFVANKKKVIVGIEIPKEAMNEFLQQKDSVGLSKTGFFSYKRMDARNSEAWFRTILDCAALNLDFCFFDELYGGERDKNMFENLKKAYLSDTNSVLITLSGNVHNKLLPYKEQITMGCYLKEYFGTRVFSINHLWQEGSMYNLTDEGLKLKTYPPSNNALDNTGYDSYFIKNIFSGMNDYSGIFYTRKMTASLPNKHARLNYKH